MNRVSKLYPAAKDEPIPTDFTINTPDGPRAIDRVCPKWQTEFDYRLDPMVDPMFDGDSPVELCLFGDGDDDTVEAIFVHERGDRG